MTVARVDLAQSPVRHGLAPAHRGRLQLLWLTALFAVATASVGLSVRLDDYFTLRHLYGPERVRRENLRILNGKPIRVSNGDTLGYSQPFDWLIPLGLLVGVPAGAAIATFALPRGMRRPLRGAARDESLAAEPPLLLAAVPLLLVALFFANVAARTLWFAPLVSAAVAAGAICMGRLMYRK